MSGMMQVLAPVDFSDSSVQAARCAAAWAERFGGELCLLHVVPDASQPRAETDLAGFNVSTLVEEWTRGTRHLLRPTSSRMKQIRSPLGDVRPAERGKTDSRLAKRSLPPWRCLGGLRRSFARDALDALASRLPIARSRVRSAIRLGQAAPEIVAYAAEQHADVIFMASRSHGAVARALLGSVAEQVVRTATRPVVTVPKDVKLAHWLNARDSVIASVSLRTVLVPTDLTYASYAALSYARDLAVEMNATLHVLHVVESQWNRQLAYVPPPVERIEELRWRAERSLERLVEQVDHAAAMVTIAQIGDPFEEIMAYADELHADLIVMATHGRQGLERLVLGSVAQKVLRHANCPVLTLKQGSPYASTAPAAMATSSVD